MKIPRSVISQKRSLYIRTRIASRCCDSNCNRYTKENGSWRKVSLKSLRKTTKHGHEKSWHTEANAKPHYELWHGRVAPFSPRAWPTTIKKICGMVRRKNKVYIAGKREKGIREQERRNDRNWKEKRARGDSQWYLYSDWSVAKILDSSFLLPFALFLIPFSPFRFTAPSSFNHPASRSRRLSFSSPLRPACWKQGCSTPVE